MAGSILYSIWRMLATGRAFVERQQRVRNELDFILTLQPWLTRVKNMHGFPKPIAVPRGLHLDTVPGDTHYFQIRGLYFSSTTRCYFKGSIVKGGVAYFRSFWKITVVSGGPHWKKIVTQRQIWVPPLTALKESPELRSNKVLSSVVCLPYMTPFLLPSTPPSEKDIQPERNKSE